MIIPMALGAWCFQKKGACSIFFSFLAGTSLYYSYQFQTALWPASTFFSLFATVLTMMIIGAAIVSVRKTLDSEEKARQSAEESQRQTALASARARQLDQIKSQFMQNVNHELRTPLMAAYSYFEYTQLLLEQDNTSGLTHTAYIKNALSYCEELRSLVNHVLEMMEIGNDSRPLPLARVAPTQIIQSIFTTTNTFHREQHRTRLITSRHQMVWAQEQCLRHVLYHLLSNAYKYAPPESIVTISIDYYNNDQSTICLRIQDKGPGIPPAELPMIFDHFTRLQRDIGGSVRGTGLGLAICKHLVEAMYGKIWVESSGVMGEGSCFYFTLPNADYPSPSPVASAPAELSPIPLS